MKYEEKKAEIRIKIKLEKKIVVANGGFDPPASGCQVYEPRALPLRQPACNASLSDKL